MPKHVIEPKGYFFLWRKMLTERDPFWGEWDKMMAWIILLGRTNWSRQPAYVRLPQRGLVPVYYGEAAVSLRSLSEVLGWSRRRARGFMRELLDLDRVRHTDRHGCGIYEVVNWHRLNATGVPPNVTPIDTPDATPHATPLKEKKEE